MIETFPVHVPDADLHDLAERLDRVRLPEPETVPDTSQGVPLERLNTLLRAWREHDWRALEQRWNAIGHYRARLDGLDIAFWHVRSAEPGARPLLLTHGWPGSVLEFENMIGPLTDPVAHGGSAADAFHVVIPALPGYGFSERPAGTGWGLARTARAWAELMAALGYEKFAAHGGDWGSFVSIELATQLPERLLGLHLTMPVASPLPEDRESADEAEQLMLAKRDQFLFLNGTHSLVLGARPQTLGYALLDSPAGLAAWLGERLDEFSGEGGVPLAQQLDNIALYWFTRTGASSSRWYWETRRDTPRGPEQENALPVTVPTACSFFPGEPFPIARRWAERRFSNLTSWNEMKEGGHFPGWEQPGVLVAEIREAFLVS
ncbi:epoxide hydrolase family protein [Kineosporia babensis]|uniref:Epoxide hydrolase 1 n=1 Tax=Kineosporia babensis TaxID=499548 RepID=A0A9X1NJ52_9ACTN|nr:epoxide hydrolase [Kineosporia babensis]MCD5314058.1 epoxide hydrolase 1 [Kineosporia babensis]